MYTHLGTRLKILKFSTFLVLTVITWGNGILVPIFCAFGYTYLCLLGVKTCSGPFRSFSKPKSVLGMKVCFKVWFWRFSKKTSFWTILPPVGVSKRHFGASRQSFLGDSGDPNMHKNGQKGLLRCRKAQNNFQNTLGVLRKPFPNFRKIVEFATFRQHWLGQY